MKLAVHGYFDLVHLDAAVARTAVVYQNGLGLVVVHDHLMGASVLATIARPQRAYNLRRGDVIAVSPQDREYERAVHVTVVVAERDKHLALLLRVPELAVRTQVLGYRFLAVTRMHQLQPRQKVHHCEQRQEHEPEPEAYEKLFVEQIYWQGALHAMLMNVIRHVSNFKVAKSHSTKLRKL